MQARHNRVARIVSLETADGTCGFRDAVPVFLRRCCLLQSAKELVGTVMPTLRKVTHMRSSKLSVNCEHFAKQTQE